ncbi:LuxR C-terminal-related transcriptional regulator [Lentzea flava]|uniref:Helix-turn-helix transcriptional regulator n=1 Tax=Lentzea flava TaxID=103732 RepID=A0ABQ2UAA3_9PSEU|nr:response regulator transcription factor [Lentzea flava]MCP2196763.1 two component transcriptional regulator, LuxR family [Lentzea flava]GGU15693.1 helix-turn-helix transcriptional regulator [Lentzea flava]
MATLVIGDDHRLFADALGTVLIQQGFTVLAIEAALATTIAAVAQTRPDLCLLDRHFADGEGTRAIADVRRAGGGVTKVIMLTADHDPEGMGFAMASGAAGYVHKSCGLAALVAAIRRAYAGDAVELLSPPPVRRAPHGRDMDVIRLASFLTHRERQCLALLADGYGTAAMAQRLGVSTATVRTHVQAVLTKLGVHSRLQAASLAVQNSLVDSVDLAE